LFGFICKALALGVCLAPSLGFAAPNEVRETNKRLVGKCLSRANEMVPITISQYSESKICRRSDKKAFANYVDYTLMKFGDEIIISMRPLLKIMAKDDGSARRIYNRIKNCAPYVEDVWARYNITLKLDFELFDGRSVSRKPVIEVFDEQGRSDELHYFAQDPFLCPMIVHETGHMMDLDDEYEDPECPNRRHISKNKKPWSFMDSIYQSFQETEFFPRHLKTVLKPLCGRL
jgi:hypothetical protein